MAKKKEEPIPVRHVDYESVDNEGDVLRLWVHVGKNVIEELRIVLDMEAVDTLRVVLDDIEQAIEEEEDEDDDQ